MKYKIAYIIDSLGGGGAERQLVNLAKNLPKPFSAEVISLSRKGYKLPEYASLVLPVHEFGLDNLFTLKGLSEWLRLTRFLKSRQFDLVQTHLFSSDLSGLTAAWLAGIGHRISSRRDIGFWQKPVHRLLYRFLLNPLCKKIIINSPAMITAETPEHEQSTLIYNGLDTEIYKPRSDCERQLQRNGKLGIGRHSVAIGISASLTPVKAHSDLIQAAARLYTDYKDFKVFIFGDGPLKASLEAQIENAGLSKIVIFMGRRENMHDYYPLLDILISSSLSEGTSNAILEAMSCGLPVLATSVGGSPWIIQNGENGYLAAPASPHDLGEKLLRLIKNHALRMTMGNINRNTAVSRYSNQKMVMAHVNLYKSQLQTPVHSRVRPKPLTNTR